MKKIFAIISIALVSCLARASVPVVVNGTTYTIPQTNEKGWGTNVTTWIQAISANTLQPTGGAFTLGADVNFGNSFGVVSPYYKSGSSNIAGSGILRLNNNSDAVSWRNAANSADLSLLVNGSNQLTFGGSPLGTAAAGNFVDSGFNIYNASDNTKKIAFSASGITTATTRTLTSPDASGTLILDSATQTLTNKTLTSPLVNTPTISSPSITGAASLANGTAGAPSLTFTSETADGIYHVGTNEWGLSVGGVEALDLLKSTGGFGNLGMGGIASSSDQYPLLMTRTNVSQGTIASISNPSITANAYASFQATSDNGNGHLDVADFTGASTVVPYVNAGVIKASGTSSHLNLISSVTGGDVGIWTNGDFTSAGQTALFGSDHSTKLYGPLKLNGTTSGTVTIQPQATAGTYSLTLPNSQGTTQTTLVNDGSGNLSWGAVGSGGAKNYLGMINGVNNNGNFETGSLGSWVLGNVSLTSNFPSGTPTFGSGANVNLSETLASGGSQLAGSYSLFYSSSGASTVGDFLASPAFTIDSEDKAKVMQIKFYYSVTSGANFLNLSGTSSNSFGIAIYDITNSAWIMPAGVWNLTQNSGTGYVTATFQTTSNSTQYRLVLFNANASGGTFIFNLDDFFLGPQTAPMGPARADYKACTVTGSWVSNTTYSCQVARDGDTAEFDVLVSTSGAPTSTALTITLPSGMVMDSTKLNAASTNSYLGAAKIIMTNEYPPAWVRYSSSTVVDVRSDAGGTPPTTVAVDATHPNTFGAGGVIHLHWRAPIVGWSSNSVQSPDTDTRVVAFQGSSTSTQSMGTSDTQVTSWTATNDTHGAFSSNTYTVPVSGYYQVVAQLPFAMQASSARALVSLYKNGSSFFAGQQVPLSSSWNVTVSLNSPPLKLNAGDTLTIYGTATTATSLVSGSAWGVTRVSGPATVTATDTVGFAATAAANSLTTGIETTLTGWTTGFDHTGSFNASTGVYTLPVSGSYSCTCGADFETTVANSAYMVGFGGSGLTPGAPDICSRLETSNPTSPVVPQCTYSFHGIGGSTVYCQALQGSGGTESVTGNSRTLFTCTRTGNY